MGTQRVITHGRSPYRASKPGKSRRCERPVAVAPALPGTVRPLAASVAAPVFPDLGPDIGEVDGRGHERGDRQNTHGTEATGQDTEVEPDHRGHTQDDQPERSEERRGGPE